MSRLEPSGWGCLAVSARPDVISQALFGETIFLAKRQSNWHFDFRLKSINKR
jgi:hypothetical protein